MPVAESKRSLDKLISELAKIDTDVARRKFLARHRSLLRSEVVGSLPRWSWKRFESTSDKLFISLRLRFDRPPPAQ